MIKRKYLIYFLATYIVVSIVKYFSSLAAYLLLIFCGFGLAIPLYKFAKEQEKDKSQQQKTQVAKNKLSAIGDVITFLGVLLVSVITLCIIFRFINFMLALLVILIRGVMS